MPATLRSIHHQARSVLTSAELALHGLSQAPLAGRDQQRLRLVHQALRRMAELLSEMEAALPVDAEKPDSPVRP